MRIVVWHRSLLLLGHSQNLPMNKKPEANLEANDKPLLVHFQWVSWTE